MAQILLPEALRKIVVCDECGEKMRVSPKVWHTPRPDLFVDLPDYDGPGVAIRPPVVECPGCRGPVMVLPDTLRQPTKSLLLFGDEAKREFDDGRKVVWLYGVIGASKERLERAEAELTELRTRLLPDRDPTTWRFHMKYLTNGKTKEKPFVGWTTEKRYAAAHEVVAILASVESRWLSAVPASTSSRRRSKRKSARHKARRESASELAKALAFQGIVFTAVDKLCGRGVVPHFAFDAETPQATPRAPLKRWQQDEVDKILATNQGLFVTKGIRLPSPTLIPAGSHAGSELADALAYVAARHIFCALRGQEPRIDLAKAGKVFWLRVGSDGGMQFTTHERFPATGFATSGPAPADLRRLFEAANSGMADGETQNDPRR